MSTLPNILNPIKQDYKLDVNPILNQFKLMKGFMQRIYKLTDDEAKTITLNILKEHSTDPMISVYIRDEKTGDKFKKAIKLSDYIKDALRVGNTIAPSLTIYKRSGEDGGEHSLIKEFTDEGLARRSVAKRAAADAFEAKDFWKASELTDLQKVLKLMNNALSGAFASPGTPHYNPSAHYALTSTTRTVSSIGNVKTESIVTGNRIYLTIDFVLEHILSIVEFGQKEKWAKVLKDYNIYIPNTIDLLNMIKKSTSKYWDSEEHFKILFNYIETLDGVEKAMILYTDDLYHFNLHNREFTHLMITRMGEKHSNGVLKEEQANYIKLQEDWKINLASHICLDELRGMKINVEKMKNSGILKLIAGTLLNINDVFDYYGPLLNAMLGSEILPVGIAHAKEMVREAIVLSDTDSTCGSYENWVTDILGREDYSYIGVGISASVMTLVSLSTENAINIFTTNMNVGSNSKGKLKMKNEFYWKTFAVGSSTKHYYAMVYIKEGFVFEEPELELKGSSFINSKSPLKFRNKRDEIIRYINECKVNNKKIDTLYIIQEVRRMEDGIVESVLAGDLDILESGVVKGKNAYNQAKLASSPYQHNILWNRIFAKKYGAIEAGEFPYLKYSVNITSKKLLLEFLNSIEDLEIRENFEQYIKEFKKEKFTTFLLPKERLETTGVPIELRPYVNVNKIIISSCKPLYLILETLNVIVPQDKILKDLGY